MKKYISKLIVETTNENLKTPYEDLLKKLSFVNLHEKKFNLEDLNLVHLKFFESGFDIYKILQNEEILESGNILENEKIFLNIVEKLGQPQLKENRKTKEINKEDLSEEKLLKEKEKTFIAEQYKDIENKVNKYTIEFMISNLDSFNYGELEEARFFYLGKPTNLNVTTFYFVLKRLKLSFLKSLDLLTIFVYKTLWKNLLSPYIIIIDFSFYYPNDEFSGYLFNFVTSLFRFIDEK
jgi:hypothetical protein